MATLVSQTSEADSHEKLSSGTPPLEHGDHLTGVEFIRRRSLMTSLKQADLVEGRVYIPGPVSETRHGQPHAYATAWLAHFSAFTPATIVGCGSTTKLDSDNIVQPDAYLRIDRSSGGTTDTSGFVVGPPDLIVDVVSTSAQYDLHEKLHVYRRTGVREYLVWRTMESAIDVFVLKDGAYLRAEIPADGVYRSSVFPGLWLNVPAMLNRDMAAVLRTAQEGVASPGHETFVKELAGRATPKAS